MPRARKKRCIYLDTNARYFKPRGVPLEQLDIIRLTFEELEAIRLKDLLGLEQTEASEKMGVSQPTFHRILKEARNKVSDALVNSKAIEIFGGDYEMGNDQLRCLGCGNSWETEVTCHRDQIKCPKCNSSNIINLNSCIHDCVRKKE
ncbi:MAG: hypothetical protein APG12_01393 [Candidatus Methanofastidiosum methylothiophilum]|uniref:UPF0251 protein APG10_00078 n=1 Tax=Candidatus Methanofastidiosum methylothiophilum TaxID=1705564 RepID=A0A150INH4_9EURY|nr:MAG: hypothetical protein APG10_00078 [Candidatus Methanofastidiosum methylthiophilus]KYC47141.1 MAG: hypothetical protein APG11_01395 [Candidatus Methanofastidiosum methylthiophilus]KYC49557.1 MAG: hypothetical protein APG12_01393 [Candidatus Methanofastidiosum methylthiophilus]